MRSTAQLPCLRYRTPFKEVGTRPDWHSYPEHSRWAGRGQVWGFNEECADPERWIHSQLLQTWQASITFLISPNMKFRFKANGQKVTMARVCRAYGAPPRLSSLKGQPGLSQPEGAKNKKLKINLKKSINVQSAPKNMWVSTFGFQSVATAVRSWVLTPSSGFLASRPSAITRKCGQNLRGSRLRLLNGARWELVGVGCRERGSGERQIKAGASVPVHLWPGLLIGMCETLIPTRCSPGGHTSR